MLTDRVPGELEDLVVGPGERAARALRRIDEPQFGPGWVAQGRALREGAPEDELDVPMGVPLRVPGRAIALGEDHRWLEPDILEAELLLEDPLRGRVRGFEVEEVTGREHPAARIELDPVRVQRADPHPRCLRIEPSDQDLLPPTLRGEQEERGEAETIRREGPITLRCEPALGEPGEASRIRHRRGVRIALTRALSRPLLAALGKEPYVLLVAAMIEPLNTPNELLPVKDPACGAIELATKAIHTWKASEE